MNQASTIDFGAAIRAVADAGMLVSTITVRQDIPSQDAVGQLVDGSPPASTVIVEDIPCMIGVPSERVMQSEEVRTGEMTREQELRQVNLDGYYPEIDRTMTVEVDGEFYNVRGVVHDSQRSRTILVVEAGA